MRVEPAVIGLHACGAALALAAAQVWPRPGQAALLAPLGDGDATTTLLDQSMQQNATMAERTSAASLELLGNANDLNGQIARLQRQDEIAPAPLSHAA